MKMIQIFLIQHKTFLGKTLCDVKTSENKVEMLLKFLQRHEKKEKFHKHEKTADKIFVYTLKHAFYRRISAIFNIQAIIMKQLQKPNSRVTDLILKLLIIMLPINRALGKHENQIYQNFPGLTW